MIQENTTIPVNTIKFKYYDRIIEAYYMKNHQYIPTTHLRLYNRYILNLVS